MWGAESNGEIFNKHFPSISDSFNKKVLIKKRRDDPLRLLLALYFLRILCSDEDRSSGIWGGVWVFSFYYFPFLFFFVVVGFWFLFFCVVGWFGFVLFWFFVVLFFVNPMLI